MKKIIHLSDLHVGHPKLDRDYLTLINEITEYFTDDASDYVIIVTGDLIDNAEFQENYTMIKDGFQKLKAAGFPCILVVPGNHDYGNGTKGNKKYVKTFQELFFEEATGYPRLNIIDAIAFIGLDSMAAELHWYDRLWAEGELGKAQLQRLASLLEHEDVRRCKKRVIYLHHHPFDARPLHQLKDTKKFHKILKAAMDNGISIDALLYGHNHEGSSHNGEWGIPRCYDGGSSTIKQRPKAVKKLPWYQVNSSIRVIDIKNDDPNTDLAILNESEKSC